MSFPGEVLDALGVDGTGISLTTWPKGVLSGTSFTWACVEGQSSGYGAILLPDEREGFETGRSALARSAEMEVDWITKPGEGIRGRWMVRISGIGRKVMRSHRRKKLVYET